MANHRDQAKFDRAGWRLMILAPVWMTQLSLLFILIGTSSYLLANAIRQSVEVRSTAVLWECTNITVGSLSVLLTAYEIYATVTEILTPKVLAISNLVKLVGVMLSMIMDGMATGTSLNSWADGTLALHSFLIVSLLVLGSYAAWKWRCLAQYDDYHHPGNVKPFGFNSDFKKQGFGHHRGISEDMDWDLEIGNTVEITSPGMMAPSPEPTPTETRERGSSFTKVAGRMNFSLTNDVDAVNTNGNRSRSNSAAALMSLDTSYDPASSQTTDEPTTTSTSAPKRPVSYISTTGTGNDRRTSYNHTRDTSFDAYVAQQHKEKKRESSRRVDSGSNHSYTSSTSSTASSRHSIPANPYRISLGLSLKNDVDDAFSNEFGWGTRSRSSSQESVMVGGQPPAIAVTGGSVKNAKNVRDSLTRAPSDESQRGALGSLPESPREDADAEEEESGQEGLRRQRNLDEASRALLGETSRDDEVVSHPASLRPARPISVIITPPPKSPTVDRNPRMTWGSAYSRS